MNNCYLAVQMLFLKYKCYFFGVQNNKILSAQYKLLPPYGANFAALWPSTDKQSAVQKYAAIF